jgi:hypothetical protein
MSGGLRLRYSLRYSKWTVSFEAVDDDRTERTFSRRIVMVRSQVGARWPATTVAWLRVDADEAGGGADLTASVEARLVGRARLFVLLGFRGTAYARAMVLQVQGICQQVLTVVLEEFAAQ